MAFHITPAFVEPRLISDDAHDTALQGSSWSQHPVAHLLVATDLTQSADRAIERSLELADLLGAQLTLLHVIDERLPRRLHKHCCREVKELLHDTFGSCRRMAHAMCPLMFELATYPRRLGSDAIILGVHGGQLMEHDRFENTAENVVHYSGRPNIRCELRTHGTLSTRAFPCRKPHEPMHGLEDRVSICAARPAAHH